MFKLYLLHKGYNCKQSKNIFPHSFKDCKREIRGGGLNFGSLISVRTMYFVYSEKINTEIIFIEFVPIIVFKL